MDNSQLRAVGFLRNLTDEELAAFADLLLVRQAVPREQIIEEGTPVTALYIVADGIVHIRRLAQKREMLLGRLGVGGFFGEINFFDPGLATASVYAMKPTRLAVAEYGRLRDFMETYPAAGYKIVSTMMTEVSHRLRQTSSRLVSTVYWTSTDGSVPAKGE